MTVSEIDSELRLWMSDEYARGCGSFVLHHSPDLGGPYEAEAAEPRNHDGSVRLTLVVQPDWPANTWRLIPCCATIERQVKVRDKKEGEQ